MIKRQYHSRHSLSTRDFAYEEIKLQIIKGVLPPEEHIVEEKLAAEIDISRTPLREALQRLEIEELVVRQTNGRLKVAPISVQEVEEIFTIRVQLEGIVVAQATNNATVQDIRHLKHIIQTFAEVCREGNLDEILYYGGLFHSYLYDLSGNKTAVKILYQLNDHIHRYRRLVPGNVTRQSNSIEEHEVIVNCIAEGDEKGAKKAMENHITNSLHVAIEALESLANRNESKR